VVIKAKYITHVLSTQLCQMHYKICRRHSNFHNTPELLNVRGTTMLHT